MTRILLVKTSSMGDVVHNLTTVSDIARALPGTEIDWLVEKSFAAIPAMHPGVHRVIPVELRNWRKQLFRPETWNRIASVKRILRERSYDSVIDTQGLIKSAVIARWAGRPVSGYDRHSIREPLASLYYSKKYSVSRDQHAVDRNRQLAAKVFGYKLDALPMDYGIRADAIDGSIPGLADRYVVCLHGTSRESKLWPEADWLQTIAAIRTSGAQPVLAWGSELEKLRAERLANSVGSAMIAPRLDLPDLARLLGGARGVIGVDTGPVHLAAALGCKTVALYTDTEPGKTGVRSADPARSINLGTTSQKPSPEQALAALAQLGII